MDITVTPDAVRADSGLPTRLYRKSTLVFAPMGLPEVVSILLLSPSSILGLMTSSEAFGQLLCTRAVGIAFLISILYSWLPNPVASTSVGWCPSGVSITSGT